MAANDNSRSNYRRPKLLRSNFPVPEKRDILAWEIDSTLDPMSEQGQTVVGFG